MMKVWGIPVWGKWKRDGGEDGKLALPAKRTFTNDEPAMFDELGRDTQLSGLVDTISRAEPPLVIGVCGDWGSGKTSFMRVLQNLLGKASREKYRQWERDGGNDRQHESLQNNHASGSDEAGKTRLLSDRAEAIIEANAPSCNGNILTIWFNPWEHQFEAQPVIPLLDAIRLQQRSGWDKVSSKVKDVMEDPRLRIIGKAALGVAEMAGPPWLNVMTRAVRTQADQIIQSFSRFQDEFEKCMRMLTADNGGRIVIFIDDLDRCEAKYVVKILESLKLYLLNRHCVFVLGCAEKRIRRCLVEGGLVSDDESAMEYLDKMIQLVVTLPDIHDEHVQVLVRRLGCEPKTEDEETRKQYYRLLSDLAWNNPRRLKRFIHWYKLQQTMVENVDGLRERAGVFCQNPALNLKVNILRFLNDEEFWNPGDFKYRELEQVQKKSRSDVNKEASNEKSDRSGE